MKIMKNLKSTTRITCLLLTGVFLLFVSTSKALGINNENNKVENHEISTNNKEVKKWRWEEMYPADMREALKEMPIAWVVFSPLEWHGESMSFGTDPIIGQHVMDKIWKQVGGVRIPTIYIGSETRFNYLDKGVKSHWGLEVITKEHNLGSIYVRTSTLQMVLEDYLYFLKREGFKMVVVSTGHGGTEHVQMMQEVSEKFSDENFKAVPGAYGMAKMMEIPEELHFKGTGGHADFQELSILGAINRDMVDVDRFGITEQDRKTGLKHENKDKIDFEKAEKLIDFIVQGSVEMYKKMVAEMK